MRPGTTIIELLLVLTLLAIFATIAAAPISHSLDIIKVRSARENVFALATQARAAAGAYGGASLIIDSAAGSLTIVRADGQVETSFQIAAGDVTVSMDGATRADLRYDAFGIGRMTSRTIRLRRGNAQAVITVSAYGRLRRS